MAGLQSGSMQGSNGGRVKESRLEGCMFMGLFFLYLPQCRLSLLPSSSIPTARVLDLHQHDPYVVPKHSPASAQLVPCPNNGDSCAGGVLGGTKGQGYANSCVLPVNQYLLKLF